MKKRRTVWARVEEVLIENGKPATQKYGAGLVGKSQPSAALWNKPNKYPEMDVAIRLAERLGVCVQWLLNEEGPKRVPPANDPHLDALYMVWSDLPDVERRDLVGYARARAHLIRESTQQPTEIGNGKRAAVHGDSGDRA